MRRQISFDFAPGRSAASVIKEIQEKAVKEVIKAEIEAAPKGTTVEEVVQKIQATETPNTRFEQKPTPDSTPEPTPEPTPPPNTRFEQKPEPTPAPTPEPTPAPTPTPNASFASNPVISSDVGNSTDDEVEAVYQGITFDFAPGVDPEKVIKESQESVAEGRESIYDTPSGGSDDFTDYFGPGTPRGEIPTPDDVFYTPQPVGPLPTLPTVALTNYAKGGTWYAVTGYPGLPVAYFIEYTLPGGNKIYYYADRSDLDALEGIGAGNEPPIAATVSYNDFKQGRISGGSIADVVGTDENYATRVERTLMAPTGDLLLPEWANNDLEIKDLFYIAVAENWTDTKFLREMAKKNSFKERYPAFQDMLSLTGGDHEQALVNYQGYERRVRELNNRYGEETDPIALAAESIKKGFTLDDLSQTYDIFERAEQNAGALLAFQSVVKAEGLDFDVTSPQGIVDFFKGAAPTQIYDLYEASSITEQASKLNLDNLSVEEALEIAKNTPGQLTNQQVSSALQSAAQSLLKFREYIDLGSYGLDADQVINLSLGYKEPGGMTEIEMASAMSRIMQQDENLQNLSGNLLQNNNLQQGRQIRSIG
mgnify:CR=1 FL=1